MQEKALRVADLVKGNYLDLFEWYVSISFDEFIERLKDEFNEKGVEVEDSFFEKDNLIGIITKATDEYMSKFFPELIYEVVENGNNEVEIKAIEFKNTRDFTDEEIEELEKLKEEDRYALQLAIRDILYSSDPSISGYCNNCINFDWLGFLLNNYVVAETGNGKIIYQYPLYSVIGQVPFSFEEIKENFYCYT